MDVGMTVRISRCALTQLLEMAQASPAQEICGVLLGQGEHVTGWTAATNVADDPARRFEIDPAILIAAYRSARNGGPAVLGSYHSHPGGSVEPSACDAGLANPDGSLWLILSGFSFGFWRAQDGGLHGRFAAETAELTDEPA